MKQLRIIIIHEGDAEGFGAGSPDLLDFFLVAPTVAVLEAALPAALQAFCKEPVGFTIITRPPGH
ncbi:hypothetical protein [Candidatus Viadribacter manganicus]|uniref:Uncharacterized protein n=1 Tax=Candidatus Viadribacter manganicus TaxID=1759059 RepID=A0A1B1AK44_9PROT|nr:hypothetical protein [Candidatus Viadribacter manganicus]ANP46939.1 hypothetical protein ATE48_13940 [Candidatus Viadribacter manganicus]